jgi:hypothetical protein
MKPVEARRIQMPAVTTPNEPTLPHWSEAMLSGISKFIPGERVRVRRALAVSAPRKSALGDGICQE